MNLRVVAPAVVLVVGCWWYVHVIVDGEAIVGV
jgi:hypothetical protein